MSTHFTQLDRTLFDTAQDNLAIADRPDHRELIVHGAWVWTVLDQMMPKHARQCHRPTDRVHEWVTTWANLERETYWPGSRTALRACVEQAFPHLLQVPVWRGTRYTGIRILRLDHAGQGILHDIEGKHPDGHSSWRLARAASVLFSILRCADRTDASHSLRDIGRHVDELYALWEHRTAQRPPDPDADTDTAWEAHPAPEPITWTTDAVYKALVQMVSTTGPRELPIR